jgi:hypothetical protein
MKKLYYRGMIEENGKPKGVPNKKISQNPSGWNGPDSPFL